jgi:hypothetical protein
MNTAFLPRRIPRVYEPRALFRLAKHLRIALHGW